MRSEGLSGVRHVALKHNLFWFMIIDVILMRLKSSEYILHRHRLSLFFMQLGMSYHEQLSVCLSRRVKRSGTIMRDFGRLIMIVLRYGWDCDFYWSRRPSELISALSLWTHALLSHVDHQFVSFVLSHHCTEIKLSAAAWAEFGQALGAGALKNLKKMELNCMIDKNDVLINDFTLQTRTQHRSSAAYSLRPCITVLSLSILNSRTSRDHSSALTMLFSKLCHWRSMISVKLAWYVRWIGVFLFTHYMNSTNIIYASFFGHGLWCHTSYS
jgi:hypothetical protein